MKVTVDRDRCIGSGQCVTALPAVFDQREEDGTAFPLTATPPARLSGERKRAATGCPAQAITVAE